MEPVDTAPSSERSTDQLPPFLLAALTGPKLERRGWQTTLAPVFIGLFLWVAFFDQIPAESVPKTDLRWPILGAAVGGALSFLLLYLIPATWGFRTGKPLAVVATSTFGVTGAAWVPGLLLSLMQVVWLAVSTFYATELGLRGLVLFHLLDARYLRPLQAGALTLVSPLFMLTALLWCFAAAFVGKYLVRVIAALMNIYPILPALLLGSAMMLALSGLPEYHPVEPAPGTLESPSPHLGLVALLMTVQMIFGFFASAGLTSADWGAASRAAGDVRAGGAVGVALASWVIATLAILTVAGAVGKFGVPRDPVGVGLTGPYTYHAALVPLVGARGAGMMYLAFGLASLAPTCYASFVLGTRLHELRPRLSRTKWTLVGASCACPLIFLGVGARLFGVFSFLGAWLTPVAGAMAADYVRAKGSWPGARLGVNRPGLFAWALGAAVGLLPGLAHGLGWSRLANLQPAALIAFVVAFVGYLILAALGGESPHHPHPDLAPTFRATDA